MGGTGSTYGGEILIGFWWRNLQEGDNLEGPGVDGGNIKTDLQEVGWVSKGWTDLTENSDRWKAVVNAVTYSTGNLLTR